MKSSVIKAGFVKFNGTKYNFHARLTKSTTTLPSHRVRPFRPHGYSRRGRVRYVGGFHG